MFAGSDSVALMHPGFPTVLRTAELRRLMFTDVAATSPWRATRISHEQFLSSGVHVSPWFEIPGMRLELIFFDLMHIGPLGIFRSLVAGVLWDMCRRSEMRNLNDELALRLVWQEFRDFCKGLKIAPPRGTLSKRLLGDFEVKLSEAFCWGYRPLYLSLSLFLSLFLSQTQVFLYRDRWGPPHRHVVLFMYTS
jgi:hypothetical protein